MDSSSPDLFIQKNYLLSGVFEVRKLGVHLQVSCTKGEIELMLLASSAGSRQALAQIFKCERFLVDDFIHHSRFYTKGIASLMEYFQRRGWEVRFEQPGG